MNIYLRISICFSLLNLVLNLIFIPKFGAMAAAVIACGTQSLYALCVIYFARIKTGIKLSLAFIPLYLGVGLVFYAVIKTATWLDWNILLSAAIGATVIAILFFYKSGFTLYQVRKILAER